MRFLILFWSLFVSCGYASEFDKIVAGFPMSQHDLAEGYEDIPQILNDKIADYHAVCKIDEKLLPLRIQKLKNICALCLNVKKTWL